MERIKNFSVARANSNSEHLDLTLMPDDLIFYDYFHFDNEISRRTTADQMSNFLYTHIQKCR